MMEIKIQEVNDENYGSFYIKADNVEEAEIIEKIYNSIIKRLLS